MIEPGDKLSARYRELAREEPPAALDAAILKAARAKVAVGRRSPSWMGPVSIAAVLVLGIGVSLRMQMEKPGIETSLPSSPASEYSLPQAEPPPQEGEAKQKSAEQKPAEPARADSAAKRDAAPAAAPEAAPAPRASKVQAAPVPKVLSKERGAANMSAEEATRNAAREPVPNPFTDAPVTMQAPIPVSPPVTALSAATAPPPPAAPAAPAAVATPPPRPAAAPPSTPPMALGKAAPSAAEVVTPAPSAAAPAPAQAQAPPAMRAKREGLAADAAGGARELRRAAEPDPDPLRELERIAGLRAAGNHAEADRALEQFRRRHPDFRISDALWDRVRPR